MAEYIEREAIQKRLNRIVEVNNLRTDLAWFTPYGVNALIEEIPAADVRPVVKSKWADNRIAFYRGCPECGAFVRENLDEVFLRDFPSAVGRLNYCPNCGADMRGES